MVKKKICVFAGNGCKSGKEKYYYSLAFETGVLLAKSGFVTVTGGGPGLMNETMRGAYETGGETIGVQLICEGKKQSEYFSKKYAFASLKPRQKKLIELADGFIALPGGIGTFYEIFEVLALKRKNEIVPATPLILIDGYFRGFRELMEEGAREGFIRDEDLGLFKLADSPQEAVRLLVYETHQ